MFYKKIHKNERKKNEPTTQKTRIIEAKVGERGRREGELKATRESERVIERERERGSAKKVKQWRVWSCRLKWSTATGII